MNQSSGAEDAYDAADRLKRAYLTIEDILIGKTVRGYMASHLIPSSRHGIDLAKRQMRAFHRQNLNIADLLPPD